MKIGIIHRVPWPGSYWEEVTPIGHTVLVLRTKGWWGDYFVEYANGRTTTVDCADIEILDI